MPAKLERCVEQFMSKEENKGRWPDHEERKRHAYAICNAAIKLSEEDDEIVQPFSYIQELEGLEFEEKDGKRTSWIQALPLGDYDHPVYGKMVVTKERIKRFVDNVKKNVRGVALDIDFEHKRGPDGGRAAGWIKDAQDRGDDGLYVNVEWTGKAAQEIKEGHWRYFSPEFVDEWKHPKSGKIFKDVLFGGGLTNRPFLKDIAPINLADYFETPEGKYPQEDANYREASESAWRCSNCAFFRSPNSCLIVKGKIDPDHVSRFFQAIPNQTRERTILNEEIEAGLYEEGIELRDIPKSERDKRPASDFAGKNRSFPIFIPEDVTAAVNSLGRAGANNYDSAAIKRNIIRIAKRKGSAFTVKLPEAWSKSLQEEELMEEFLKKLRESLGLPEDASEEKLLEEVGGLKTFKEQNEEKVHEDEKAKKFAEDYPEEAKRMADLERSRKLAETEQRVSGWTNTDNAIPPVVVDKVKEFRMELSEDSANKFDDIFKELTEKGTVRTKENGRVDGGGENQDNADKLNAEMKKLMDEDKDLSRSEARRRVLSEHPELAEDYRPPVTI